jgi:hypothetical protein
VSRVVTPERGSTAAIELHTRFLYSRRPRGDWCERRQEGRRCSGFLSPGREDTEIPTPRTTRHGVRNGNAAMHGESIGGGERADKDPLTSDSARDTHSQRMADSGLHASVSHSCTARGGPAGPTRQRHVQRIGPRD